MADLVKLINDRFGKGTVATNKIEVEDVIPTGSIALDRAIGVGGYPTKRITEIYGPEGVGKSTLCLSAIRMAQAQGRRCIYIDAENTIDTHYAEKLGVSMDTDKLIIVQPSSAEDALTILEMAVESGEVGLAILDSVAAMVPSREAFGEGEISDSQIGMMARLMGRNTRRLTPLLPKSNTAVIYVNQVREKISTGRFGGAGGKDTPGGWALKHAYSLRIQLNRFSTEKDENTVSAINIIAEIKKNKVAIPYQKAEISIIPGVGIDVRSEIFNILLSTGNLIRAGAWYKDKDGTTIGQGQAAAIQWCEANPDYVNNVLKEQNVSDLYKL